MVNVNMLKAKIIEKNIEKKKIAECLGISPTSLNYKINGKTEFKGSEIQLLSNSQQQGFEVIRCYEVRYGRRN